MLEDKQKNASESNNHGVWVCHKCGWTYPNPHPSAKHRRNHKKHCGKIGNSKTVVSPRDRSSSPDPDDDLHEEEHNFPAKPVLDTAESNGTHDQVVVKGVITEVHGISNRVEEEEFADAVTDFSEASQSPNNELVQSGRNDHPRSENRSVSGPLFHDHESVAFKTDHVHTSTEGHVGPKSSVGFDSVEASSLQFDSTESVKVERHEDSVDFMGKPVHSHVQYIVGLRKDGLACILEPDSPIEESSNTISGDASDAPGTKICSEREAQDVAPVMKISPEEPMLSETSGSTTIITGDLNAALLDSRVADRSVLIDSDTRKAVIGNCQGYEAKTCDQEKGKDNDIPVSMVPTNQPPGHIANIISDVFVDLNLVKPVVHAVRTVNEEPQETTGDYSNCQANMGESTRHVALAPLTFINPGTFLKDCSGGHEDLDLTNQEAYLGPPAIEALTDMADNSEVGVAYSNRPHTACCSLTEKGDFAPAEDTKAVEVLDSEQDLHIRILSNVQEGKGYSLGCASPIYNVVTVYDETISEHRNTCVGHRESPQTTTLPEDKLGNDDSESGCKEYAVHPGDLSNFSTVTPENATQIAEPLVELVIPVASEDPTPIMESATELALVNPDKVAYEISKSEKQDDLSNRDISVSAANGVLASSEESEVQVEIVHANSIEKEAIWKNSKIGSSVKSQTEITYQITDFDKQEFSKEHSSSMSRPFDASSSSTGNILHVAPSIHLGIGPMECDMPSAVTNDEVTKIRNVVTSEDEKACYAEKNILPAYGEQNDQILDLKRSTEKHVVFSSMVSAPAEREHREEQTPFVPHIGDKHHLESQPNQNHHESLIDSTGPDTTVHVAEENSSQQHLAEACSPSSDNHLDDSTTKDNVKELTHSDSAYSLLVKEQKFLPITDDAKVVERKDVAIPTGDANSNSSDEKTVVVCEKLDAQSKDFKGCANKHVEISSLVLAPVERELKEDQLPSDTQCQTKLHEKFGPNQNHLDETDNNIKINQIASYISNDEESSSAYLTTSSGPSVVGPLEQCSLKEPRQEMVDLDSFDCTKIKDLHSEVDVTTAQSYVETSASGEDDTHASSCQMDRIEDGDNLPTGNVVSPLDLVKAEAGNQVADKSPSSDSWKINVASEAHQNSDGADIFEPPSFMTLVEASGYHNGTIKPPEMRPEHAVQKPTSSATEAVWFPSLPSVVNDSGARKKNEESITKAVNSKRARTPLKNLLVENTEKGGTKLEDLKATPKGDVKSGIGTIEMKTNTEGKASGLESDNVCASKFKLGASTTITASTGISSPSKLFGNKKDKRKNRGLHSWIYVCCSSIN